MSDNAKLARVMTEDEVRAIWEALPTDDLIERRLQHAATEKFEVGRKKLADEILMARLTDLGFEKKMPYIRDDDVSIVMTTRTTKTINRASLILAGVDPKVVDKCTVKTTSKPYLVVSRPDDAPIPGTEEE